MGKISKTKNKVILKLIYKPEESAVEPTSVIIESFIRFLKTELQASLKQ